MGGHGAGVAPVGSEVQGRVATEVVVATHMGLLIEDVLAAWCGAFLLAALGIDFVVAKRQLLLAFPGEWVDLGRRCPPLAPAGLLFPWIVASAFLLTLFLRPAHAFLFERQVLCIMTTSWDVIKGVFGCSWRYCSRTSRCRG